MFDEFYSLPNKLWNKENKARIYYRKQLVSEGIVLLGSSGSFYSCKMYFVTFHLPEYHWKPDKFSDGIRLQRWSWLFLQGLCTLPPMKELNGNQMHWINKFTWQYHHVIFSNENPLLISMCQIPEEKYTDFLQSTLPIVRAVLLVREGITNYVCRTISLFMCVYMCIRVWRRRERESIFVFVCGQ